MNLLQHFPLNTEGIDYVVGDIHGNFSQLTKKLEEIGFEKGRDRLFSVGDIIDRGAESCNVLPWLEQSRTWFFPVRGNHEDMIIKGNPSFWNGASWFKSILPQEQTRIIDEFNSWPLIIEVETSLGLVGVMHASCPVKDWEELQDEALLHKLEALILWDRTFKTRTIQNISCIYHGHTHVDIPLQLGNVIYIDTDLNYDGSLLTVRKLQ